MAVTVEGLPSMVLDDEYHIVEVSESALASFAPLLGRNVLDAFPGSRALFLPYYERARRTGESVEFAQYYGGYVARVLATPAGTRLIVTWKVVAILDLLTLEGLRSSLEAAIEELEDAEHALHRQHVRQSLRVMEGGVV